MEKFMEEYLKKALYARGFLISTRKIENFDSLPGYKWNELVITKNNSENFYVYYDPRNETAFVKNDDFFVFVLGVCVDLNQERIDISDTAQKILETLSLSKNDFLNYVDELCGRFIIFYGDSKNSFVIQDACGMRSCFYSKNFISSHYSLINDIEKNDFIEYWETYNALEQKPWYLPGNYTPYKNIYTLIPNHELNFETSKVSRIWPRSPKKNISAVEVQQYFENTLKRQIELVSKKYKLLVSLTGGKDSRITLSTLKNVPRENFVTFSYKNNSKTDSNSFDNEMAKYLTKEFNLPFKQLMLNNPLPAGLKEICKKNHYHEHVPRAIPKYITELPYTSSGGIHLRSNLMEIIRERGYYRAKIDSGQVLNRISYGYTHNDKNPFVQKGFDEFYNEQEYNKFNADYDYSDIFYWEYRMGLWHSGGILLNTDIAFDTYCLFNQRKLLEIGLSMPKLYIQNNYLVYETIKHLWPEILFYLPNSEENLLQKHSIFDAVEMYPFVKDFEFSGNSENFYSVKGSAFFEFGFIGEKDEKIVQSQLKVSKTKYRKLSFVLNGISDDIKSAYKYSVLINGIEIASGHITKESELVKYTTDSDIQEVIIKLEKQKDIAGEVQILRITNFRLTR